MVSTIAVQRSSRIEAVDTRMSSEETNEILCRLSATLLQGVDSVDWWADRQRLRDLLGRRDIAGLASFEPNVFLGPNPREFYLIEQVRAFFRKRKDLGSDAERERVAYQKFLEAEAHCRTTNQAILAMRQGRFQFRPLVQRVLHEAAWKISRVLGDPPEVSSLRPRFGPGATTVVKKADACPLVKLARGPACSTNVSDPTELLNNFNWLGIDNEEAEIPVHGARLSFVPKNTKTFRAVVTEPPLNAAVQLGLGDEIARRLRRRAGIDIRNQSFNQEAARMGSIYGNVATIDLSSASDTIATRLVEELVGPAWSDLFDNYRSSEVIYNGDYLPYLEKISSMGNGFTFPLETLIFWALAESTADIVCPDWNRKSSPVLAYGDDIIVPTACAEALIGVLRDLGFTPNPDKSFWTGKFRESCGADWFLGTNVRPVFVDDRLTVLDLYRLHNFFHARKDFALCEQIEKFIPSELRQRGPKGLGDGHLHTHVWVAQRTKKMKQNGFGGYVFKSWVAIPRKLDKKHTNRYFESLLTLTFRSKWERLAVLLATYRAYRRETEGPLGWLDPQPAPDDSILTVPGEKGYRLTRLYVHEPPRLGN